MAPSLVLRPYAEVDRAAVLALFDANVPSYFAADERGWLEDSLDDLDGPPFVVTIDGEAAAFGGYEIWGLLRQGAAVLEHGAPELPWPGSGPVAPGGAPKLDRRGDTADALGDGGHVSEDHTFLPQPGLRDGQRMASWLPRWRGDARAALRSRHHQL